MSWVYRLAHYLFKRYFRYFHNLQVVQDAPLPSGGAIIVANHVSFLDPPLIGIIFDEEIHALARASLFKNPLFAAVLKRLNTHPIQRAEEGGGSVRRVMEDAEGILKRGQKLILFPEGRRSDNGGLQPMKPGAAMLAIQANVPIIPVFIHGLYEVWPKNARFPKLSGKVTCHIGAPIKADFAEGHDRKKRVALLNQELERVFNYLSKNRL